MTALAMRQTGLKPAAKIVLYWLADHLNGETGQCNPSINRLAECCEMSRRSVETHLQDLAASRHIAIKNTYRDKGGKTSNSYMLLLSESDTQNLRMGSAKSAHGDTQNLRMKNLGTLNLGNEPLEPNGSLSLDMPDDTKTAFDMFNELADEIGLPVAKVLSKKRKASLKARLAEAGGIEGWRSAMDKVRASPLCTGNNNRGWVADLDFILQQSSFTKLMEGSYDARNPNHNAGQQRLGNQTNAQRVDASIANAANLFGIE